jgi:hypothetical protein
MVGQPSPARRDFTCSLQCSQFRSLCCKMRIMSSSIRDRVNASFPEGEEEKIKQYLDWLRSAIVDLSANMRRAVTLLVFLIAVFEVIFSSPNAGITAIGFHIDRGSIVLRFIPALVAYLGFQLLAYSENTVQLVELFTAIFTKWSDKAEQNDLDLLVLPTSPLFWNIGERDFRAQYKTLSDKVQNGTSYVFMAIILLGLMVFEAQAYYLLFGGKTIGSYIVWTVSLSVTVFCLSMALVHQMGAGPGS